MFLAQAYLEEPLGKRVLKRSFGSKRLAQRWCRRQLARQEFERRTAEVRCNDRLVWSGECTWTSLFSEKARA